MIKHKIISETDQLTVDWIISNFRLNPKRIINGGYPTFYWNFLYNKNYKEKLTQKEYNQYQTDKEILENITLLGQPLLNVGTNGYSTGIVIQVNSIKIK